MLAAALSELPRAELESSPWWCECRRAGRLTNSASNQAQIQGYDLAHPKIYLIRELLEHMKGSVLKIQSCRISTIQGSSRISI